MRGFVIPAVVCSLVAAPVVFAALGASRKTWLAVTGSVCAVGISAWIACSGFGWGVTENLTESLPGHIYLHKRGEPFGKGDLVAYRWKGGATYPRGSIFIKRVVGVPGDVVKTADRAVWVAGSYVGIAKTVSRAGVALEAAAGGLIGPDEYFVATNNPDSLDSRYALSGNVKGYQIIGRAYEIF